MTISKWTSYLIMILLLCTCWCAQANDTAPRPSAEDILAAYANSLAVMRTRVRFKAETIRVLEGFHYSVPKKDSMVGDVRREGTRLDILDTSMTFKNTEDTTPSGTWQNRGVVTNESMFSGHPADQPPDSVTISSDTGRDYLRITGLLMEGIVLDGMIVGDNGLSLPEVMKKGTSLRLREKMENVDGHNTYVIEAGTPYGEHVLWVDPEYNFNPRRIEVRKSGTDLLDDVPLATAPSYIGPTDAPMAQTEIVVDSIELTRVGDVCIPTAARIVDSTLYADGRKGVKRASHKRSEIDFNPDFNAIHAFVMDVPNGTNVYFNDIRGTGGLRYQWQNGKVVAKVDDKVLDALNSEVESLKHEMRTEHVTAATEATDSNRPERARASTVADIPGGIRGPRVALWIVAAGVLGGGAMVCLYVRRAKAKE